MHKKILFINPPWYRLQGLISTYPPMGCLYIAGLLEKHGYDCRVWHADYSENAKGVSEGSSTINMDSMSKNYENYLSILRNLNHSVWDEVRQVVKEHNPDVIGIVVHTASFDSAKNIADIAKQINPDIKIICGGPHATVMPQDLIKHHTIDFVVRGEGEHTTLSILENMDDITKLKDINGIYFKDDGRVIITKPRIGYEDLSKLPFPAKHLLVNKDHFPSVVFQPIFTTRGCPHQCIYCTTHKIHGYKTRILDPEITIKEIKSLMKEFNVHHFFICDDTFGQNKIHTKSLLNKIIESDLGITWGCQTRGEVLTEELVALMKKAGCTQVSLGVETGSSRIRKLIKKGNTVNDMKNAANLLRKHKIEVAAFFMFGFPGETTQDVEMTRQLMREINPYTAHCNIATPDPGTELMTLVEKEAGTPQTEDWATYFHQNPELFKLSDISVTKAQQLISEIRLEFDRHNKRRQRFDIIKRAPLYARIMWKEKLFKHPKYLWNKAKDLI